MENSPIREKSYDFALRVVRLFRALERRREFVLSKQLLRAATSIGANVEEAQAAQSRPDFISKMSIASKEAREAHYWLRLLRDAKVVPTAQIQPLVEDVEELIRLLTAIVKSSRRS